MISCNNILADLQWVIRRVWTNKEGKKEKE
jgi:hypothetical protein